LAQEVKNDPRFIIQLFDLANLSRNLSNNVSSDESLSERYEVTSNDKSSPVKVKPKRPIEMRRMHSNPLLKSEPITIELPA
jgi:hypothetical protein